ncbi:hypothetical protein HYC85_019374 [Camellia sinensis]|uniref:Mannosyl-oligosaccharide glucosidase n=1 Tax=Camellia sinensis TaxID=4442 RepID=A0A7J7GLN0_CAMSI|nr:hypothetical protein HYC85_019374 [Camellia sinensis]
MLVDQDMTLMTSFLKSKEDGSGYGGDWAVRIDVQSEKSKLSEVMQTVHRFFYLANEDGNALSLSRETLNIRENSLLAFGSQTDVGSLNLNLESMDDLEVHYSGFRTSHIHNLSDLVQQNLGAQVRKFGRLQLSDTTDDSYNILVFQILGRISFRTDVAFISGTGVKDSRLKERLSSLTAEEMKSEVVNAVKRSEWCSAVILTGGCRDKMAQAIYFSFVSWDNFASYFWLDSESISTGKAAVASLLSGIGYFYGQSKISVPSNSNVSFTDLYVIVLIISNQLCLHEFHLKHNISI